MWIKIKENGFWFKLNCNEIWLINKKIWISFRIENKNVTIYIRKIRYTLRFKKIIPNNVTLNKIFKWCINIAKWLT